jgi:Zn-dependent protease
VPCTGVIIHAHDVAAGVARLPTGRYTPAMAPGVNASQVIAQVAIVAVPVLAAIVFHEVAHGAVAYALGDPTAARHGRLTLNPLPHIDPFGTLLLPGILLLAPLLFGTPAVVFGYARPVPIDVRRLRRPRRDAMLVALAGPGMNLVLALVSALVLAALPHGAGPASLANGLRQMAAESLKINVVLAVFNLLPVPPLDGGRVLTSLLPAPAARAIARVEAVGFVVVLLIVMNSDLVTRIVQPVMAALLRLAG